MIAKCEKLCAGVYSGCQSDGDVELRQECTVAEHEREREREKIKGAWCDNADSNKANYRFYFMNNEVAML